MFHHYAEITPGTLARVLEESPVAFVPVGSLEFHGWHLPLGFDALKAAALCERVAAQTGGVVLPPSFYGFAGGHRDYPGSIMGHEEAFRQQLNDTLGRLITMGFNVILVLTGHYPHEQVGAVKEVAATIGAARPDVTILAMPEFEAFPNETRADHAGKWETSIALALMPESVDFAAMENHADPLHGIHGDPRTEASVELGHETVNTIVRVLTGIVTGALHLRQAETLKRKDRGDGL